MKRLLCIFALTIPLWNQDNFGHKIVEFEVPYNKFVRAYFGCPPEGETSAETCSPQIKGELDRVSFEKACEKAKDLFGLKGDCADVR